MGARIRNRLPDWFLASSQDELLSKSGIVSIVNRETICSTFIHRWNMFYGYKEFVWSWLDKNHWHSGKLKNCISAWTLKDKISSCNVFVLSKLTSLVTLSDRKPQIFKKKKENSPKSTIFGLQCWMRLFSVIFKHRPCFYDIAKQRLKSDELDCATIIFRLGADKWC